MTASRRSPIGVRMRRGSRLTMNRQIRSPSRRKKNVVNSTRNIEATTSSAVVAVASAPVVRLDWWSVSHFLRCCASRLLSCLSDRWKMPPLNHFWILSRPLWVLPRKARVVVDEFGDDERQRARHQQHAADQHDRGRE